MNINEYLSKMTHVQNTIFEFIDENDENEEHFKKVCKVINDFKEQDDLQEIKIIVLSNIF